MAAATDGPAHLLSLKVMRLSRPDLASAWQPFYSSSPSFSAHSSASILSLQGNSPLSGHPKTLRDFTSSSEVLILPASFGSIQLGETFSSCLCVNNETPVNIEVAQVRVEIQTATSKMVLYEMDGSGKNLPGGDALEHIVHHEIKELGQHVLACTVTYRLPQNARAIAGASEDANDPSLQTFRKFYKFAVTNPFSVKTKVHSARSPSALFSLTEREKIFLEVHIQNLTQDAIYFERMRLECTDEWETVDGNVLTGQTSIFSGSMALMQSQDMRQYLYILTPKVPDLSPSGPAPGSIIPLGRLDISWRSRFGEPGRLLTSMLSRRVPLPAAQPASALPPHLKKSVPGTVPPRSYPSPIASQPQSRPGTPVLGQRGASPAPVMARTSISSEKYPVPHTPPPELEVQLLVRHVPRDDIAIEKPFCVAFSVVISSTVQPGQGRLKRKVTLAVQHVRRQSRSLPKVGPTQESFTPRLPYCEPSSPAFSIAGGFNYALAHQKILTSSPRPPATEINATSTPGDNLRGFPPPFYEGDPEHAADGITRNVLTFVGQSVTILPSVEIDYPQHTARSDKPAKVQHTQDFELTFVSLRSGFSIVQGLRILLTDDQLVDEAEQSDDKTSRKNMIETLKEYDTVAEVWVAS